MFVMLTHTNQRWLIAQKLPFWDGHAAVVVFFVLSGYVIAYVTDVRERTWQAYAASRLARLYSLALLAILVTPLLDHFGRELWPMIYKMSPDDQVFARVAASVAFAGEAWWQSMMTFSNLPYWSLNYEAWYYVGFGVVMFASVRARRSMLIIGALALGPKLLLLAPCWIAGVWLYRTRHFERFSGLQALFLLVLSFVGIWAYRKLDLEHGFAHALHPMVGDYLFSRLSWASYFGADWLLASLVVLNFGAAWRLSMSLPGKWAAPFRTLRYLGNLTFPIYIFHYPVILFWSAVVQGSPATERFYFTVLALSIGSCVALGALGDKLRPYLHRFAIAAFHRLSIPRVRHASQA